MTPLTEEMLEQLGFGSKYKSIHTRWYYWGFALDQVPDEDGEGGSIPQEEEWNFNWNEPCNTLEDLKRIMERETKFILDIDTMTILNNPELDKRVEEEKKRDETILSNYSELLKLGITEKNINAAKYQPSLELAIDYLKRRGKFW